MFATELRSAFPASLAEPVSRVAARLGPSKFPPHGSFEVIVEREVLAIPYRIYFELESLVGSDASPVVERLITSALFTRHYDGFVREAHLRLILGRSEPWLPPFVVQLVGEYVIEIIETIRASLDVLDRAAYKAFVESNAAFMERTRQRACSYWNHYYRRRFPRGAGYPGFEILKFLQAL